MRYATVTGVQTCALPIYSFLSCSAIDAKGRETMKWSDGHEYPVVKVEVSSESHSFYTGKQKIEYRRARGEIQAPLHQGEEVRLRRLSPSVKKAAAAAFFFSGPRI